MTGATRGCAVAPPKFALVYGRRPPPDPKIRSVAARGPWSPPALPLLTVALLSDVVIRPGRGKYLAVPLTTPEAEPPRLLRWQTPDSHGQPLMTCHGRLLASPYLRLTMFAGRSSPQGHPQPWPPALGDWGDPRDGEGWRRGLCSEMDVAEALFGSVSGDESDAGGQG